MKKKQMVPLLVLGAMLAALVGCESQQNNNSELPETDMPDKAFRPSTSQDQRPQNSLLPNPNIGQGLPSGAVPWTNSDGNVPGMGEETAGHNPDNSQWTNWNGTAR